MMQAFALAMALLLTFSLSTRGLSAPCEEMTAAQCVVSLECVLDDQATDGEEYTCRLPENRCESDFQQEVQFDGKKDFGQSLCEAKADCAFVPPGSCYCPLSSDILCVCGGGKPSQCLEVTN